MCATRFCSPSNFLRRGAQRTGEEVALAMVTKQALNFYMPSGVSFLCYNPIAPVDSLELHVVGFGLSQREKTMCLILNL